jgi:hypothetical protein
VFPSDLGRCPIDESEWLRSTDPARMLAFLWGTDPADFGQAPRGGGLSARKLRLFACAVVRMWSREIPARKRFAAENVTAIEGAERYADDPRAVLPKVSVEWVGEWCVRPDEAMPDSVRSILGNCNPEELPEVAAILREIVGNPFRPLRLWHATGAEPWSDALAWIDARPWLTPNVLGIARRIHDESDFALLPILADALEDAGCTDEAILRHLRGYEVCPECLGIGYTTSIMATPQICWTCKMTTTIGSAAQGRTVGCGFVDRTGPHVRGCVALDLILGKT